MDSTVGFKMNRGKLAEFDIESPDGIEVLDKTCLPLPVLR